MCLVPDSENSRLSNQRSNPSPVLFANSQNKFEKGTEPQSQKQKFHLNEFTPISAGSSQNLSVTLYTIYCFLTNYCWVYSIPDKSSETIKKAFLDFIKQIENITERKSSTFELIAVANTKANLPLSLNPSASSTNQLLPILINRTAKLNG